MLCERGAFTSSGSVTASGPWSLAHAVDADSHRVRLSCLVLPPGTSEERALAAADSIGGAASAGNPPPALLRVLGAGLDQGTLWLAEEEPSGPSLREHVALHGPLAPEAVTPLLHQIAAALLALRAAGGAHPWLTPDNVCLTPAAVVGGYIWPGVFHALGVDFLWPEEAFAAPEARAGNIDDPRAEVYSAAALAAFAATGRDPRERGVLDALPEPMRLALARGLRQNPDERYDSVKEMAVDLTVEQAILLRDSAEQTTLPDGGEVPNWAADLLAETTARRNAGKPLVEIAAPEPPPAPTPEAPPPAPRPAIADMDISIPVQAREQTPVNPTGGFQWGEGASVPARSWGTTIIIIVSAMFVLAAIALTVMR